MKRRALPSLALATATLAMASTAFAQEVCGFSDGQWIGGDEASSDIALSTAYQEQLALVLGGNAYVSLFTVSGPTTVRVEAQGRGTGDPLLDLYDSTGSIILSDDDSGGDGAARAEIRLTTGTYCISVKSYDGAPLTASVRVGREDQEALTTGTEVTTIDDTTDVPDAPETPTSVADCASARPLEGSLAEGFTGVASVNENAFWSFSIADETPLSLTAENSEADPILSLFDIDANYLDGNDDFDGLNSRLNLTSGLTAGDYCIQIEALDGNDLPITVNVTAFDPAEAERSLYASGEAAPPLDGSVSFTDLGVLNTRLRQDVATTYEVTWFTIEMPEAGLLLAEAVSVSEGGDPWLVAFDDLGRKITQNDDYGEELDSLIAARVSAGQYLIGVRQLEENGTGNVRMVFERYTAAR